MKIPENLNNTQCFYNKKSLLQAVFSRLLYYLQPPCSTFTRKSRILWGDKSAEDFHFIKKFSVLAPLLAYQDFDRPFIIQTDVSLTALGAVLSPVDKEGIEHPMAYSTQALNNHVMNYTVTKQECLAVIFSVKQFLSLCT